MQANESENLLFLFIYFAEMSERLFCFLTKLGHNRKLRPRWQSDTIPLPNVEINILLRMHGISIRGDNNHFS